MKEPINPVFMGLLIIMLTLMFFLLSEVFNLFHIVVIYLLVLLMVNGIYKQ